MTDKVETAVKIYMPPNHLSEMVVRPGGKTRKQSTFDAQSELETLRESSLQAIENKMLGIEDIVFPERDGNFSQSQTDEIMELADGIINLAGTFGLDTLVSVMQRFCDLLGFFSKNSIRDEEAILVHVLAMQLCKPGATALSKAEIEMLLSELQRVHDHYYGK